MVKRILIIDDEDDIREVAALSLETTAGWTVYTASSGRDGIAMAMQERPDAILMDVMMPEVGGPTTFQRMKELTEIAGIPVVLLTAKVQSADHKRFGGLGVAAVLVKPFDPLTLAAQISKALGWLEQVSL